MSLFGFKGKRQAKKPAKKKRHLSFSPSQEKRKYAIERSEVRRGVAPKKARSIAIATVRKGVKKNG